MDAVTRTLVETQADLKRLLEALQFHGDFIAVDTETNGLRPYHGDRLIGMSFTMPDWNESFYISFRHGEGFNWPLETMDHLRKVYPLPDKTYVFFNAAFDLHMLHCDGFADPSNIEDVMIAAHTLNECEDLTKDRNETNGGYYRLKRLAARYLSNDAAAGEEDLKTRAKAKGLNPKSEMWKLSASDVALYAMMDTEITWRLREYYKPYLQKWDQWSLYQERSRFLLTSLVRMERNGMLISPKIIEQHRQAIVPEMASIKEELIDRAVNANMYGGLVFNPNSPSQVKKFFRVTGTPVTKTDHATLQALADKGDERADLMLRYRLLSKADSTYYSRYLQDKTDHDRLHASFNVIGTRSGRLSSSRPNLQQVPRSGAYNVKDVFVVPENMYLVQIDYATLELRIATHYAGETRMRNLFNNDEDMHWYTTEQIGIRNIVYGGADDYHVLMQAGMTEGTLHKLSDDDIKDKARATMRHIGKTANFGLLYGMGAVRASEMLGVDVNTAKVIVEEWHSLYPGFRRAVKSYAGLAEEWRNPDGLTDMPDSTFQFLRLPLNNRTRKFHLYKLAGRDAPFYTGSFNFMVQGTAAGVTETSIMRACVALQDNSVFQPVATVHDSFVFYVDQRKAAQIVRQVCTFMEDWPEFNPSLKVDVEYSDQSWGKLTRGMPR